MMNWSADYQSYLQAGYSSDNIQGFENTEYRVFITHAYGCVLPFTAREVYVKDEECFRISWRESLAGLSHSFNVVAGRLSIGNEGLLTSQLLAYLDQHVDSYFETFVRDFFATTPFIAQLLRSTHEFYLQERTPSVQKTIKLVIAYNLTLHMTLINPLDDISAVPGQVSDPNSKYFQVGKTLAPAMVDLQVKHALA